MRKAENHRLLKQDEQNNSLYNEEHFEQIEDDDETMDSPKRRQFLD